MSRGPAWPIVTSSFAAWTRASYRLLALRLAIVADTSFEIGSMETSWVAGFVRMLPPLPQSGQELVVQALVVLVQVGQITGPWGDAV